MAIDSRRLIMLQFVKRWTQKKKKALNKSKHTKKGKNSPNKEGKTKRKTQMPETLGAEKNSTSKQQKTRTKLNKVNRDKCSNKDTRRQRDTAIPYTRRQDGSLQKNSVYGNDNCLPCLLCYCILGFFCAITSFVSIYVYSS
ncbi:hypothetical protein JOB18_015089 [Solea senegalensis]|uniref:Uncharacterized protein n=1 Tax=Solea senegalensis TaxID=28829 RepID=A0AAV6R5N0_SOLSE|nr:hypothetical protein JOB18_015089 [Solea senegalensis]